MSRKILLVEPNYKNKYPPLGLMKLSTYFKKKGDVVWFFKGEIRRLIVEIYSESLISDLQALSSEVFWREHILLLQDFIKMGHLGTIEDAIHSDDKKIINCIKSYRQKYVRKDYANNPFFDKVLVTTLFTFNWNETIRTINAAKVLCKDVNEVYVGGIMSSILAEDVYKETGIRPYFGLLTDSNAIDTGTHENIDELPLDYSLLDETDYKYPAMNAYFGYLTRGCPKRCSFCAVPTLEPEFCDYVEGLTKKIRETDARFGKQKNLLLLDNNVLASNCFDKIVDEMVECGFGKDEKHIPPNQYDISIKNLRDGYNDRAYIKRCVSHYRELMPKLDEESKTELFLKLEDAHCLQEYTATKESILELDAYVEPLYAEYYKKRLRRSSQKSVDFNQGVDAKLITEENMQKLANVHISPLRIAFDSWEEAKTYERAVHIAAKYGIHNLSNYLLYNHLDQPVSLYRRMRLNIDLCEELDADIYSFPMKYHPIAEQEYFRNRNYIGIYWNKKFIRAIQAVLNATKGKIGRGVDFFNEAFGENEEGYFKVLWMPETFIIFRMKYKNNLTKDWWREFNRLDDDDRVAAKEIIAQNDFSETTVAMQNDRIKTLLAYYQISRNI